MDPLNYNLKCEIDVKAYVLLFSCRVNSVSRAVHLELVSNFTITEFIKCFKKFIKRTGNPNIIYSGNTKTFKAGAK